jgi:hypothetical protein
MFASATTGLFSCANSVQTVHGLSAAGISAHEPKVDLGKRPIDVFGSHLTPCVKVCITLRISFYFGVSLV